jgi:hypothetical protein
MSLFIFAAMLASCMAPAALAARHDARTLRGVSVWAKPMKFMASMALFAVTTAVLMQAAGPGAPLTGITVLIIVTATFEVAYIAFQASRGAPSHYNTSDTLHTLLLVLMALGAVGLSASQAWLAWAIVRTNAGWWSSVSILGVVTGLVVTCVLATVSGFLLGGHRAPAGPGLPLVGWKGRGDLRPAHFLGVHAQQFIPALGFGADRLLGSAAHAGFTAMTCAYLLAWAALTRSGRQRHDITTATT